VASQVDIWNTALSNIGHKAQIADPDELSVEANHCRRFYPIALGVTLERFAWSFATRRAILAEVDNPVDHWMFAYALPNECIAPRAVLLPESTDDTVTHDFEVEGDEDGALILYTNVEDAVLKYTTLVTDTNKFSPMFVLSLSHDLASLLVGPIPKDMKLKKAMTDWAEYWAGRAQASNANSTSKSSEYGDHVPSHLSARN
jgi:hypothetical protein